jgi:hypothetical protein
MKWNAVIAGIVGVALVSHLSWGIVHHSFNDPLYDVTLVCLIFGFAVKMWQVSKQRNG